MCLFAVACKDGKRGCLVAGRCLIERAFVVLYIHTEVGLRGAGLCV